MDRLDDGTACGLLAVMDGVSKSPMPSLVASFVQDELAGFSFVAINNHNAASRIHEFCTKMHDPLKFWINLAAILCETIAELKEMEEIFRNASNGETTISAVWIINDRAYVTWVGDSRVELTCMDGRSTPFKWIAHKGDKPDSITKSFCVTRSYCPEISKFVISPGDIITVMSDGAESQLPFLKENYSKGRFCNGLIKDAVNNAHSAGTDDATIVACRRTK